MDIARDYHTKQSKSNKYHTKTLTCGISNMTQMNLSMQQKETDRCRDQIYGCQKGVG